MHENLTRYLAQLLDRKEDAWPLTGEKVSFFDCLAATPTLPHAKHVGVRHLLVGAGTTTH